MTASSKKILIAPDSFKGSLSAGDVCKALQKGIMTADSAVQVISVPLSDGGEGFLDVFRTGLPGSTRTCFVADPLGKTRPAEYYILEESQTAIIEMARASGLELVAKSQRNPLKTTSYGTGQLILDALKFGIRDFIIGIGGSATNDSGAGMAQALGVRFYDENDAEIVQYMNGELIGDCRKIAKSSIHPEVMNSRFQVACDVRNPLLGPDGAVRTYAIQKGAQHADLPVLERNLDSFFTLVETSISKQVRDIPGSGAAGGMGAGLIAFLDAVTQSGIDLILDTIKFEELLNGANLIITGEGQLDDQTFHGKAIAGVTSRARNHSVPVIAVTGKNLLNRENMDKLGLTDIYTLTELAGDGSKAIEDAPKLLESIGQRIVKIYCGD